MPKEKSTPRRKPSARRCGLCGKTKKLTRSECCDRWICNDNDKYVLFSFSFDSCYRNHHRYSQCSNHYNENHNGAYDNKVKDGNAWKDCEKCKEEENFYEGMFEMKEYKIGNASTQKKKKTKADE